MKNKIDEREKLLQLLESEREREKGEKFQEYTLIIEAKKISENLLITKGFLYQNKKLIIRGSFTSVIKDMKDMEKWFNKSIGEKSLIGITFDSKEQSIGDIVKGFLSRSIKEGSIQDFIP
jgi:hypothetical protein